MKEMVLILDNIRSVLNVGAIFRTADGSAVSKIYILGITPDPNHKKLQKTALGAENTVEWEFVKNPEELITKLKKEGFEIIVVEQSSKAENFYDIEYPEKIALIFGNEITGVSSEIISKSDKDIIIPMLGKKNSLNVATCVGILMYYIRAIELKKSRII